MPTYVYRCRKCRHMFERFHGITDETVRRCPRCKAKAERVPAGGAGILFKGSGFYITDHRSKAYKEQAKQEKQAKSETPGGSSAPPAGGGSGKRGGEPSGSGGGASGG